MGEQTWEWEFHQPLNGRQRLPGTSGTPHLGIWGISTYSALSILILFTDIHSIGQSW